MATAYPLDFSQFEGIYEVPEVARYIVAAERERWLKAQQHGHPLFNLTSRHLIRWIRNGLAHEELSSVPGRDLLITFEDVVSMRVIAALRARGISFQLIYKTESWLRNYTKHPRPFAVEAMWTMNTSARGRGGADILVELRRQLVLGSRAGQAAFDFFKDYIQPVHGLTFSADDVAITWEPREHILLDPEIQFGSPCIKGTRIPTRTIWGQISAGDSRSYVGRSYRLSKEEIEAAIQWEESLAATRVPIPA